MSGKVNYVIFKLFEFEKVESKSRQVWKHILQSDFHTKPDGLCAGLKYIFSLYNGNWLTFSNLWGRVFCTATACRGAGSLTTAEGILMWLVSLSFKFFSFSTWKVAFSMWNQLQGQEGMSRKSTSHSRMRTCIGHKYGDNQWHFI